MPTVNYNGDRVYFPNTVTTDEIQDVLGAMTASAKAVAEFGLMMGSASIAEPLSGLAGIATGNIDNIAKVQDALTYQPRTKAGQVAMKSIAKDVSNLANETGLNHLSGYWRDKVVPALQDNLGVISGSLLAAGGLGLITAMSEFVPGSRATRAMPFPQEGAFKYLAGDLNPSPKDVGFRGGHTAPVRGEYSAPLHDLAGNVYPADIYNKTTQARYYGWNQPDIDNEAFDAINATKGNPDAEVTIYRAVPKDSPSDINSGDWVTTSKAYAEQHGDFDDDWQILSAKVKAGDLFTDGNSPHEYGWNPAQTFDPSTADISHLSKSDSFRYESAINNEDWDRAAELAKKPEIADLPMDNASRMARADEMGFDGDDAYRGIYGEYNPEKSGAYQMFTSSPQDAGEYGNNVIKSKIKRGNNLEVDGGGNNFNSIYVGGLPSDVFDRLHPSIRESLTARTDDIAHAAKEAGYDSVTIKDIYDKADNEIPIKPRKADGSGDWDILAELGIDPDDPILGDFESSVSQNVDIPRDYNTSNVDIVFDPSNIRSVNAAFDPAKRSSSNLLAGTAAATPIAAALLNMQTDDNTQ